MPGTGIGRNGQPGVVRTSPSGTIGTKIQDGQCIVLDCHVWLITGIHRDIIAKDPLKGHALGRGWIQQQGCWCNGLNQLQKGLLS